MTELKELILEKSKNLKNEIIKIRRHIHMYPELSYREYETSRFICEFLNNNNISYREGIAGTGIIGEISGNTSGNKVIALRTEMDALPVTEENITGYSSRETGIMHACGHDAHIAMLAGAAKLLNELRKNFGGKILLVFQPGEEVAPGGAKLMIESGAFSDPKPDIVIAQHVLPELESGKVGYKPGKYMASSDEIYITIKGKGGHAALPHLTTDQVYIASKLVTQLKEEFYGRISGDKYSSILGIGRIKGEGATNIIPDKVEIAGTLRTFDEGWRNTAIQMIHDVAGRLAEEFSVDIEVKIVGGYPVLINDENITSRAIELSSAFLGSDMVQLLGQRMSSDDFSYFARAFPSLYYRIGVRKNNEEMKMLHSPEFDIDENALVTGVANLCWLVLNLL